ncbi:MAG: hemerythrin domain-containing protein [Alysiella sp.]|uniref:hemerythrin domain-containing protein n=1 Tax=Alysiella sp. TaxID=1872483 RepID=UPI0026DDBAD5|nr:hemerythrin domain-containing protein [Alysiella sp.]MDO4434271.1 hemerythrin domain-containing protein [Alysiella sp.]
MLTFNPQATPTWDEPIDMLYACHSKVKRFCAQLEMLPKYLAEHGLNPAARDAITQICTYFNQAAPLHHDDEEQDFFPTLLHYAPQAQNQVDELNRQHQILHENWTELHQILSHVLNGNLSQCNPKIIQAFTHAYAQHMAIEEPLFELGRQHIPLAQQHAIGQIMAARRHPTFQAA